MSTQPRPRTRRRMAVTIVAITALAMSGCATRVSHDRVVAAAGADTSTTSDVGAAPGAAPVDPGIGSVPVPVPGTAPGTTPTAPASVAPGASTPGKTTEGDPAGGGADAGSTTRGSDKPAGTTPGPANKTPINAGVLGTFSGVVGDAFAGTATGIKVWAQWINARGGVNGHPVRVLVGDDGGDPAKFNSLAQQFVERDKVVAMLWTSVGLAPGGNNSYLDSRKILTFGTEGGLDGAYSNIYLPTSMPTGHSYADAILYAASKVAVPQNKVKIASFACSDFSICDNFDQSWSSKENMTGSGFQNVYRARPSVAQPDFTAPCLSAQQAGAQVILLGMDNASIQRIADACARQNYRPLFGIADLLALPTLPLNANLEGSVVGTKVAPFVDTSVQGVKDMIAAFAQYAPSQKVSGATAVGWTIGNFFGAAGVAIPDNPTPADFMTGLNKIKNNDLKGMTYPLTFKAGQPSIKKVCFGAMLIKSKQYIPGPFQGVKCAN